MSAFVHIFQLIQLENDFETRLDLLTSIGITTTNEEIFKACEEVRNEIVSDDICGKEIQVERNELLRCLGGWENYNHSWNEESKNIHVAE
jgi:hypothetical protein